MSTLTTPIQHSTGDPSPLHRSRNIKTRITLIPKQEKDTTRKEGRINQDGGVEGRALTPSCESTRITTGCWTIMDRKTLDFTMEDTQRPRTEEKPQ